MTQDLTFMAYSAFIALPMGLVLSIWIGRKLYPNKHPEQNETK